MNKTKNQAQDKVQQPSGPSQGWDGEQAFTNALLWECLPKGCV